MENDENITALPAGYKLHWYVIESILGQGGFGITYLAKDTNLDSLVAIKEFFPGELAARTQDSNVNAASTRVADSYEWGLSRFLSEARTLAQLRHPNIVSVYSVFEENQTAYMVMEYLQGQEFARYFAGRTQKDEAVLRRVLLDLLDGVSMIHAAGYIHRDIKPPNILIRGDVSPILLDFGSARQSVGDQTHMTSLVTPGYAPFEQYSNDTEEGQKQGPWTDIYSAAATMYFAIAGRGPIDALKRVDALVAGQEDPLLPARVAGEGMYSEAFLNGIDWGLQFRAKDRPQSIEEWLTVIGDGDVATRKATNLNLPPAAPIVAPSADPEADTVIHEKTLDLAQPADEEVTQAATQVMTPTPPRRSPVAAIAIGVVLLVVLAAGGFVYLNRTPEPQQVAEPQATPARNLNDEISDLLAAAQDDIEAGRLTAPSGNNALARYRAILVMQADNTEAQAGLARLVDEFVAKGTAAVDVGQLDVADAHLRNGLAINAGAPGLKALAGQIQAARAEHERLAKAADDKAADDQATQDQINATLALAEQSLADGRLDRPAGSNALESFQVVLRSDPANEKARAGVARVASGLEQLGGQSLEAGRLDEARDYINRAAALDAQAPGLSALRERLAAALEQAERDQAKAVELAAAKTEQDARKAEQEAEKAAQEAEKAAQQRAARNARLKTLLTEADAQLKAGQLDRAADSYRDVLGVDSSNAAAKDGLTRIAREYAARANKAIGDGRLADAENILASGERVVPGESALAAPRRKIQQQRAEEREKQEQAAREAAAKPKTLTSEAIFGKWCSNAVDMVFSERQIEFHLNDGAVHAYAVKRYEYAENTVTITWTDREQAAMVTEFGRFDAGAASMVQLRGKRVQDSSWRDYNRGFKRCR